MTTSKKSEAQEIRRTFDIYTVAAILQNIKLYQN